MMAIMIVPGIVIALTDMVKIALMPRKVALVWGIVWAIVTYSITMWVTGLSMPEVLGYLGDKNILVMGFIEILVFMAYLFYNGRGRKVLMLYPGLMLGYPVALLSLGMSRMVAGLDFMAVSFIAASVTAIALTGGVSVLRWMKCDRMWLYTLSLISLLVYIIIYGIV